MIKKILIAVLMVLCFSGVVSADSYTISDINTAAVNNISTITLGDTTYSGNAFSVAAVGSSVTSTMTANEDAVTPTVPLVNTVSALNESTGLVTVVANLTGDGATAATSDFNANTYSVQAVGASLNSTITDNNTGDAITYSTTTTNNADVSLTSTVDMGLGMLTDNTDISSLAIGSTTTADFTWNPVP